MSVINTTPPKPARSYWSPRSEAGGRYLEASAVQLYQVMSRVTGDGTGGTATVNIPFPRSERYLWYVQQAHLRGTPSTDVAVIVTGQFEVDPGTHISYQVLLTFDSNGTISPADSINLARCMSPIRHHRDNGAAGQPSVGFVMPNAIGVGYQLGLWIARLNRDSWTPEARALLHP